MSTARIEFAVQMTCNSCVETVRKCLQSVQGIENFEINLDKQSVILDTNLKTTEIQKILESSGKKVAVRGYSGSISGVSIIESSKRNVQGVVRFIQATPNLCIIDGTIDGLKPGSHGIQIHECGDLSQGNNLVFNTGHNFNTPHCFFLSHSFSINQLYIMLSVQFNYCFNEMILKLFFISATYLLHLLFPV